MKKTLLLLVVLLTSTGAWGQDISYKITRRVAADELETGKKYMIFNSAAPNTGEDDSYSRQYFLYGSGTGFGMTRVQLPLFHGTTDENYLWELETGSQEGTFKIKNVGTSKYCVGGTTLGESNNAVNYTIGKFEDLADDKKGNGVRYYGLDDNETMLTYNQVISTHKSVYILDNSITTDTKYWNGQQVGWSFTLGGKAHAYVFFEVKVAVDNLSNLSNTKAYTIATKRGAWTFVNGGASMGATTKVVDPDDKQNHIAIINYGNNYYLYSVNLGKFLTASNTLTSTPSINEQISITATEDASYPWFFKFKNVTDKNINLSDWQSYHITIDNYTTLDDGNQCAIIESADFTAIEEITVGPANGTYYTAGGSATTNENIWGPTWKSTLSADETPLLTFTSANTGMNSQNADIYANSGGFSYTLTAPTGYYIIGYTINGTANNSDITIMPNGFADKAQKITAGESLKEAVSVTCYQRTASFTLTSNSSGYLSNLSLTATIAPYWAVTWEAACTWYYDSERQTNVLRAGKVGYPKTSTTAYTDLRTLVSTFTNGHSYVESDYTGIQEKYAAYVAEKELVLPTNGTFYRLKGAKSGRYLKGANSGTNDHLTNTENHENAQSIFYLDEDGHLLSYATGQYVQNTSKIAPIGADDKNTFEFDVPNNYFGALSVKASASGENGRYLYSGTEDYANGNATKTDETDWYIEELTELPVTISDAGYATFCAPVAINIGTYQNQPVVDLNGNTGEKQDVIVAFQAKIDRENVRLVSMDDGVVPANVPVVLKRNAGSGAHTWEIPITTTDKTAADYHSNALEGTIAAIKVENSDIYTLQNGNPGVGFYKKTHGEGVTFKGFSAYLTEAMASRFKSFSLDELTDISNVEDGRVVIENAYDLQGRRVATPKKGLYIINGKKVLF